MNDKYQQAAVWESLFMTIKTFYMIHKSCACEHMSLFHLLSFFSSPFCRRFGLFSSHHNLPLCFVMWRQKQVKSCSLFLRRETVSAETQSAYLSLPSEGFSFISSPLFFFFHSRKAWRADVETVQPQWCRSDRKATTIRSKFPNLWVLCYHKQKYDGLWRVRRPLMHKRHFQNNKNVRLGLGLLAWMLTDIVVHGNSSESEETRTEF